MKKTESISIKEIAKLCEVSTATVSRVVNDNGRFSEETRKKVLDTIEKFGYRTNIIAKSLRTKKTQSVGIIVPDITNEFFANIILAIQNYYFPKGYSVLVYNTNEDEEKEGLYLRDLEAKGVDGLIYFFCRDDQGQIDTIRKHIPVVFVDRNPNRKGIVVVESDNYKGGFMATEELINSGCKDIVILKHILSNSTIVDRYEGYRDALDKYGIHFNPDLVLDMYVNANVARDAVSKLIKSGVRFDGIFACTDWLAVGALMALRKSKIKVPEQVKLVGYDNIPVSEYSLPSITTINQDKVMLGEVAAQVLLDMIDGKTIETKNIVLPVELIKRETTC